MPGKRLNSQARDIVVRLIRYFTQEKCNGGPLLPLNAVQERVAHALGISLQTVGRISREIQWPQVQITPITHVIRYTPRKKKRTEYLSVKTEVNHIPSAQYVSESQEIAPNNRDISAENGNDTNVLLNVKCEQDIDIRYDPLYVNPHEPFSDPDCCEIKPNIELLNESIMNDPRHFKEYDTMEKL